ncbi:hypothetical protein SELMODRAFT_408842 [Selaginella moellendorffii]|uniref:PHD-type domain-containing protein n=1 Tax=Selaginella moellendorffii TaxID=88036 RepID=D8RA49_SELML|nr:hypothetical protein SELMODRAFT_408842 [Selaginella moellendorffii]
MRAPLVLAGLERLALGEKEPIFLCKPQARLDNKKKLDVLKKDKSLRDTRMDPEELIDADARVPNGLHLKHGNGIVDKQGSPQLVARVYSRKRARDSLVDGGSKKSKQKVEERVNHILGKTADVILVLAGLSQMRGGKPPTEIEMQLANDAETNLSALVARISPSSLLPKQSLDSMISTMGYRKTVEGSIEPAPRPQEDAKVKVEGEDSDSDDDSSEDDGNQLQSAWDPFNAALLTSPNALSLDDDADADLKQSDDYDEIDEQAQMIRHKQLVTLVQQLKAESYVPQQMCDVSNAYMMTLVPCDLCQCIVRDTASVVVCDGCEKAFHYKCVPFWEYPKGDWSCPKCNGVKPRYGPVKKGSGTPNKMPIRKPETKPTTPQQTGATSANGPSDASKQPQQQKAPSQEVIEAMEKLKAQAQAAQVQAQEAQAEAQQVTPPAPSPAENAATTAQPDNSGGQVCLHVDWVGAPTKVVDKRVYYSSCCVGGWTYKIKDCALFRPESPEIPPYIARLQTLWEDLESGAKWVRVNWCYYPNDMPAIAGRPDDAEAGEVYESNHCDNNLVGSIQGPCQVLVPQKYAEETARRQNLFPAGAADELPPIFLCRYTYNAQKGVFQKVNWIVE